MDISSNSSDATQKPSSPLPRPMHQDDADEEDESVKQLKECSALYLSLQECLIRSNRDWKSCQTEVQALKACNEKRSCGNSTKKYFLTSFFPFEESKLAKVCSKGLGLP